MKDLTTQENTTRTHELGKERAKVASLGAAERVATKLPRKRRADFVRNYSILPSRFGQTQNVGTLQYPQFFGEMCLLVPDGGEALGTVSTDTLVETVRKAMGRFPIVFAEPTARHMYDIRKACRQSFPTK